MLSALPAAAAVVAATAPAPIDLAPLGAGVMPVPAMLLRLLLAMMVVVVVEVPVDWVLGEALTFLPLQMPFHSARGLLMKQLGLLMMRRPQAFYGLCCNLQAVQEARSMQIAAGAARGNSSSRGRASCCMQAALTTAVPQELRLQHPKRAAAQQEELWIKHQQQQ